MSACIRCRAACRDGAAFCIHCGAPQPQGPQPQGPQPPSYPPAGAAQSPPPWYPPAGAPQPQAPQQWYATAGTADPWQRPRPRRRSRAAPLLLFAVVMLGGSALCVYRLNLVPALTERIDTLLGTTVGAPAGPEGAFVGVDGAPVGSDTFGTPGEAVASAPAISAASPYIGPGVDRGALDADLASIEAAFASNDPAKVAAWVHPDAQGRLLGAFQANAGRLNEIATLLATRQPVFVTTEYAEYQVTDKGTAFTVVYQRSGDHWLLVGL